jgi:hypothetical protein
MSQRQLRRPADGHHGVDDNLRQMFAILLILPMVEGRFGKDHQGAVLRFCRVQQNEWRSTTTSSTDLFPTRKLEM